MTFSIDKSTWRKVRFGDVVNNVNDVVRNPSALGIDRVIGLEHLDPGELAVSRWDTIEDGTSFTRRVRPGQTLFGKRRSYQRKTAYVTFDAICSGDILVFYPKDPEVLLPGLLPFIASSDAFYEVALRTSAGSLSPRTRWSDMAAFEFLLPPLAEQQRISALVGSAHSHLKHVREALVHALELQRTYRDDYMRSIGKRAKASEVFDITIGRQRSPKHAQGEHMVPYLRSANITRTGIDIDDVMQMNFTPAEQEIFQLKEGDVLVSEGSASLSAVGQPAVWEGRIDETVCFQNTLLRYRALERTTSTDFVKHWCRWAHESGQFASVAHGTGILHIGLKNARSMTVPIPTASEQKCFVIAMAELERTEIDLANNEVLTQRLMGTLLRDLLGD